MGVHGRSDKFASGTRGTARGHFSSAPTRGKETRLGSTSGRPGKDRRGTQRRKEAFRGQNRGIERGENGSNSRQGYPALGSAQHSRYLRQKENGHQQHDHQAARVRAARSRW